MIAHWPITYSYSWVGLLTDEHTQTDATDFISSNADTGGRGEMKAA